MGHPEGPEIGRVRLIWIDLGGRGGLGDSEAMHNPAKPPAALTRLEAGYRPANDSPNRAISGVTKGLSSIRMGAKRPDLYLIRPLITQLIIRLGASQPIAGLL